MFQKDKNIFYGKKAQGYDKLACEKLKSTPVFEEIAYQWLEELKPLRISSTIVKYAGQLKNYLIPAFGNFFIDEIKNEDFISFGKKLLIEGHNGQKLAPKTVSDIISRMKSIRRFALLRGYE
ncbi:MAG: hypothetical protein IJ597_05960, partial [Synergistaceae bacterium]|nr:hypothetical protein [Synergistaceae bacterium]